MSTRLLALAFLALNLCRPAVLPAAENEAETLARVKVYLQSSFAPVRSAALAILATIGTEEAARTALAYLQSQAVVDFYDSTACTDLLAVLPATELLGLSQIKGGQLADLANRALARAAPEKVLALVQTLAEAQDDGSRRTAATLLSNFAKMEDKTDDDRRQRRQRVASLAWVYARNPDPEGRRLGLRDSANLNALTEELARIYMRDPDPEVRRALPDALVASGRRQTVSWSIPLLLELGRDKDDTLRKAALYTVNKYYRDWGENVFPAVVERMKGALSDPDTNTRVIATTFFASNYDTETLKLIERMATDPDEAVAAAALQAAYTLKSPHAGDLALAATQVAVPANANPKSARDWKAESEARALRILGLKILTELNDRRALATATQMAGDADWGVVAAGRAALAHGGAAETATLAATRVARGSGGVGDVVRRTLTLDPEQRADELERLYGGLDAAQRIGLLKQLNPTWSVNATALVERFLVKRLKDADPVARKTALQNLTSAFGYNSAAAHLIGAVEAIDLLNDPDPGVAQAAGVLLGALPYKSLAPLAARALLGSVDDPSRRDAVIRQAARLDREFLILCLQHKDSAVRRAARDQILPWHWDRPEVCLAILTGIERLDELPAGAPSGGDSIPQILQAALKNPARGAPYFALIGRIDDERAGEALKQAARAPERAVRWAALDALVARGDESNATLDHALARLLTAEQESERAFLTWPVLSSRLLARLDTFKAICRADRVERLRTEIQGKLNALAALGEPVR